MDAGMPFGAADHEAWNAMRFDLDELDGPSLHDAPPAQGAAGTGAAAMSVCSDAAWPAGLEDVRTTRAIQHNKNRAQVHTRQRLRQRDFVVWLLINIPLYVRVCVCYRSNRFAFCGRRDMR